MKTENASHQTLKRNKEVKSVSSKMDSEKRLAVACSRWINQQMRLSGIKQEELAKSLGVTRGNVGHYITGRRVPSLSKFIQLANIFNLLHSPVSEFLELNKNDLSVNNFYRPLIANCPIISTKEVFDWPNNKIEIIANKKTEFLADQLVLGSNCYALKVFDEAMMEKSKTPYFKVDSTIIVDPDKKPEFDSYVIAKYDDVLLFRQYYKAGKQERLKAFNHLDYPTIDITPDIQICGVVVAHLDVLL